MSDSSNTCIGLHDECDNSKEKECALDRANGAVEHTQVLADLVLATAHNLSATIMGSEIPPITCAGSMAYSNRIQKITADLSNVDDSLQHAQAILEEIQEIVGLRRRI